MIGDWIFDLESKIYTKIKNSVSASITTKYPTARFTTSGESTTSAVFPVIYIHQIGEAENARDLDESNINAMSVTFEAKVTVDTKREDAKWIMKYVVAQFKALGFGVTTMPIVVTEANMYYAVARFRRVIGSENEI